MSEQLTGEGKLARAAYHREYRKKNKEREKDKQTRYWNNRGTRLTFEGVNRYFESLPPKQQEAFLKENWSTIKELYENEKAGA